MERIDDIGFGGLRLIQDPDDFCYGIDAVLLADAAAKCLAGRGRENASIADLGTGNGIVPLILSHKLPSCHVTGFEMDDGRSDLACRSIEINGLAQRIDMIRKDISEIGLEYDETFDLVTMNPPYVKKGSGMKSDDPAKASKMTARHETTAGIDDFIGFAYRVLKRGGEAVIVHRPSRLVDIMCAARAKHMEPKELRLVCPYAGKEANICLVRLAKNGGAEMKVHPQLVVRNDDGSYTEEINIIYER